MKRLALLAALAALGPLPLAFSPPPKRLVATAVPLDPGDPARVMAGPLRFLGGWSLGSGERRFGGISSMSIDPAGRFWMLSDTGVVTRFRFTGAGEQADYAEFPLPDGPGGVRAGKVSRDSESSTIDPATGQVWVGFETRNEIWRYARGFATAETQAAPPEMRGWGNNEGAEAMVRLRDGRFLVFAENEERGDGSHLALAYPGDPTTGTRAIRFGFRGLEGFAVTDAAELPDGRVLVLMRRFSALRGLMALAPGFSAALVTIDPAAIRADADVPARLVTKLAPPLTVDNMEALAIERRGDRTIVWLASDDNFFAGQRTLLLAFEWPREGA